MDKKNNSQGYDVEKKSDDRRKQHSQENLEEQYKREGNCSSIGEEQWISIGRRWSGIHGRKNLCAK